MQASQHIKEAVKATEEDMEQMTEEPDEEFERLMQNIGKNYMPLDQVCTCSWFSLLRCQIFRYTAYIMIHFQYFWHYFDRIKASDVSIVWL